MKEKLLHTPEGVRDIYNSECKRKSAVEKRIHHILELYGYQDIEIGRASCRERVSSPV